MKKRLTGREFDVMNIFWAADEPLTASGVAQRGDGLSINTVQVVLKSLLKRDYIKVADIVYSGTVLARTYIPTISRADYVASQVTDGDDTRLDIIVSLINEETSIGLIDELEDIVKERKRLLKGK